MKRPELKNYQTKSFHHFDMKAYAKDLNRYIDLLEARDFLWSEDISPDEVAEAGRKIIAEKLCSNPLGCACKEANGQSLKDCTYWNK